MENSFSSCSFRKTHSSFGSSVMHILTINSIDSPSCWESLSQEHLLRRRTPYASLSPNYSKRSITTTTEIEMRAQAIDPSPPLRYLPTHMRQWILSIALIAFSILLTTAILLQQRGSGLGAAFGGDGGLFRTKRGLEKGLFYATIALSSLFFGTAILNLILG